MKLMEIGIILSVFLCLVFPEPIYMRMNQKQMQSRWFDRILWMLSTANNPIKFTHCSLRIAEQFFTGLPLTRTWVLTQYIKSTEGQRKDVHHLPHGYP